MALQGNEQFTRAEAVSQFLKTGRGRPENSQPRTAALRNAGVLACELWHRPGALLETFRERMIWNL